jgi:hypothetical protein
MNLLKRFFDLFKSKSESEAYASKKILIGAGEGIKPLDKSNVVEPSDVCIIQKPEQVHIVKEEDIEIIIGFDFGTSCSKVILRDAQRNISYAVDFRKYGHKTNTYLLPTRLFLKKENTFDLQDGDILFRDIKINLIDCPSDIIMSDLTNTDVAIAYFCCAFKQIRKWFYDIKGDIYLKNNIIWQINVGIPARDYSDDKLVMLFRYVALLGWELSLDNDEVTISKIHQLISKVPDINNREEGLLSIHPEDIYAIPEIIAAIVGYAKSRMRKDGMYFLIDVGASTVDVSMFNLFKRDGEIKYSILWAELGRYGVLSQLKARLNSLPSEVKDRVILKLNIDQCMDPLPDIFNYLSPDERRSIQDTDSIFTIELRNLIGRVVIKVKKDQNPNDSNWENGVPIFITGGGSEIEYFQNSILSKFSELSNMNIRYPNIIDLPNLDDLEISDQSLNVIKRFSSAYGLSYRESDIGTIIGAGSIEAISKYEFVVDFSDRYIDKDYM